MKLCLIGYGQNFNFLSESYENRSNLAVISYLSASLLINVDSMVMST